jgi:putative DNA methylase
MRGWHNRGYLPHYDGGTITQFITVHLGDALPKTVVDRWKTELAAETDEEQKKQLYWRTEKYIDKGYGECYLRQPAIAELVRDSLKHFDGERYKLISWVVMPNHIHFLLTPFEEIELEGIVHSIKSYTALKANRLIKRTGKFWQEEYFDRYIRDFDHFQNTVSYIEWNPVKAKLCLRPEDWLFSSAGDR